MSNDFVALRVAVVAREAHLAEGFRPAKSPESQRLWAERLSELNAAVIRAATDAVMAPAVAVVAAGPPDALQALIATWRTSAQQGEEPSREGGGGAGTMTLEEVIALQVVERVRVSESQTLIACADELEAVLRASPGPDAKK